jgi:hypothetical protein
MRNVIERRVTDVDSDAPADEEPPGRQEAIKQIERKRRFVVQTAVSGVGLVLLMVIWAITEFHNAGGWPSHGFSESSGIPGVWNSWIIYPIIAWVFFTAAHGWNVYLRKPISEDEIRREIESQGRT